MQEDREAKLSEALEQIKKAGQRPPLSEDDLRVQQRALRKAVSYQMDQMRRATIAYGNAVYRLRKHQDEHGVKT